MSEPSLLKLRNGSTFNLDHSSFATITPTRTPLTFASPRPVHSIALKIRGLGRENWAVSRDQNATVAFRSVAATRTRSRNAGRVQDKNKRRAGERPDDPPAKHSPRPRVIEIIFFGGAWFRERGESSNSYHVRGWQKLRVLKALSSGGVPEPLWPRVTTSIARIFGGQGNRSRRKSTWRGPTWRKSTWRAPAWRKSIWRGPTWRKSTWRGPTWRKSSAEDEREERAIGDFDASLDE